MKKALGFGYKIGFVMLLLSIFAMVGCTQADGKREVLRFGLIPADDATEMLRQYEAMANYLEGKLDMKIELQVTDDYTAAIEAMRNKHIDMAWFGPFSYILAVEQAGAEAIVNGYRRDTKKTTYKSLIITRADSGIKTLADLKGRSFAFVDPASTSGHLIPRKMLIENGIDPDNDFSTMYYAGSHNAVELAVKNGKVDAGADSDTSYNRMLKEGQIDPEVNIIIFESSSIPGSPIAVRGDLPQDLKDRIQQALIEMDEQTIHEVGGWGDIEKYVKVTDSDYDIIREVAEVLDL
ncbi:MAG: phosphonate ABC transporter substrate-binding protein [Dehalococcoidales bacterium]|nr:phosphonate ABC transporter substrate-binding protein [Dehalococcoidales bacterium]